MCGKVWMNVLAVQSPTESDFPHLNSDVRGHGHATGNVSTKFNSKSGNCLARRLSAVSMAKNHPKVFRYADSN